VAIKVWDTTIKMGTGQHRGERGPSIFTKQWADQHRGSCSSLICRLMEERKEEEEEYVDYTRELH